MLPFFPSPFPSQFDPVATEKGREGAVPLDVVRSATRTLDVIVRAVPALPAANRRLASYIAIVET